MNWDNGYEPSVIHRDVLSRAFQHPKSRDRKRQTESKACALH